MKGFVQSVAFILLTDFSSKTEDEIEPSSLKVVHTNDLTDFSSKRKTEDEIEPSTGSLKVVQVVLVLACT